MRSVPKFLSILVLVCLMGLAPADEPQTDVSERLEKLGHPLAQRYPDGSEFQDARNISDLKAFDGKLYVGHGDWGLNSGPTDLWYYDLHMEVNNGVWNRCFLLPVQRQNNRRPICSSSQPGQAACFRRAMLIPK